jgi:anti-sigma B factor antagonist
LAFFSVPAYKYFDAAEIGDVTVVRFHSHSVADEYFQEVGNELGSLVDNEECKKLLLNFSAVAFLSGAMLARLLRFERTLKTRGGGLKISNMSPDCSKVLAIVKLDRYLDVQEDEADALAVFRSD